MTDYHVAIDHIDPDRLELSTTYLGTVPQQHVDEVRAIAALEGSERIIKEHPRQAGAFMVLRDDGDLDVYVPVDAPDFRVYPPDPDAKTDLEAEDLPRGTAAGPAYISDVVRLGDQVIGGAMDYPGNPPRSTWHTTESPAGKAYFYSVAAYLIRVGVEPQVIYCPATDLLGQFGPLTQSARALQNDGARRTNREGKVNIQVEVLGHAASPWTKGFDPAKKPNYRKLIAAMRAHGIPDVWPAGKPKATAAAVAKTTRSRSTWQSKGGHFSHGQVPGNSHWDPGAIDTAIVPGKAETTPTKPSNPSTPAKPQYEPFPGEGFFHPGRHSPIITAMGRRLVALGFGKHYSQGPGPDWTNSDRLNVRDFQLSRADLKGDPDGYPGPKTWAALKVPKV